MQISHLIFTRFNIQYEEKDNTGIQPEWLEERLRLFEQYCLPSIIRQSCKDFTWILLGDIRTTKEYKKRINNYALQVPQIRTYWIGYQNDGYHAVYKMIGQEFAKNKDVFISTRLDNDDIFSPNYIEYVQNLANKGIEGIISFPIGRQTFIKDNKSYKIRFVQNHSTSRIEKSGFETIMIFDHTQVTMDQIHLFETEEPMWEEIVHGGNMLNDYVPKYHYYIHGFSDWTDLSKRWMYFQWKRLMRLLDSFFVSLHKS